MVYDIFPTVTVAVIKICPFQDALLGIPVSVADKFQWVSVGNASKKYPFSVSESLKITFSVENSLFPKISEKSTWKIRSGVGSYLMEERFYCHSCGILQAPTSTFTLSHLKILFYGKKYFFLRDGRRQYTRAKLLFLI